MCFGVGDLMKAHTNTVSQVFSTCLWKKNIHKMLLWETNDEVAWFYFYFFLTMWVNIWMLFGAWRAGSLKKYGWWLFSLIESWFSDCQEKGSQLRSSILFWREPSNPAMELSFLGPKVNYRKTGSGEPGGSIQWGPLDFHCVPTAGKTNIGFQTKSECLGH